MIGVRFHRQNMRMAVGCRAITARLTPGTGNKRELVISRPIETAIPFSSFYPLDSTCAMTKYEHTQQQHQYHQCRLYHCIVGQKGNHPTTPSVNQMTQTQQQIQRCLGSALPQIDDDHDVSDSSSSSSSTLTKATPFVLADIGEGIAEVELMQWFVQPGDHVQQFDRICEVQSDKATVEITSRYDGTVTSLDHVVGDMVKVGEPLMYILADAGDDHHHHDHHHRPQQPAHVGENHSSSLSSNHHDEEQLHIPTIASRYHFESDDSITATGESPANHPAVTANSNNNKMKVLTSPAIRKLAKEHNLELSTIVGTGPKGRVSKGDVLTVLKERRMVPPVPTSQKQPIPVAKQDVTAPRTPPKQSSDTVPTNTGTSLDQLSLPLKQDTVIPLRGYNRLMATAMTASLQIPHMMYSDEVNLNKFFQYKAEQKQQQIGDPTKRLAFLPLSIKAVSKALEHYPLLNASFDSTNNQVTLWKDHNIGIAMDTPRGLIVPVLKRCQEKSIPELTEELQRLKMAAAQQTVDAEDLKGATFTLSNIGAIGAGGKYMCPVVTPPQVAIGAIGKIERLPRFVGNTMDIEEVHICIISWGGDHRVVDGATMARFHTLWKEYMEDPLRLIMEMK